jgi:hypothetical protein
MKVENKDASECSESLIGKAHNKIVTFLLKRRAVARVAFLTLKF